jgi:UDP-GlcNAc3NAcA epimerase
MKSPQHMLVVVGARPQFVKAAAMHRAILSDDSWRATWLHTGQHHDEALSDQFFRELNLPRPEVRLTPNAASRELRLGDMMHGVREAIQAYRPDWVLVFGDTDSTLAGAWAASAEGVPLIHVEAGLRSGDWSMPEEVNRVLTDRLSSVLVCPTDAAVKHLAQEGISEGPSPRSIPSPRSPWVMRTGDVMHDNALHFGRSWPEELRGKGRVLLTMHRPSNVDEPERVVSWLHAVIGWLEANDLEAIFPVHPRTEQSLNVAWPNWQEAVGSSGLKVVRPMGYLELLATVADAPLVLTDSGGVQKEAYSLGTPCVVMRSTTEWVEQLDRGQSALAGDPSLLAQVADLLLARGRCAVDELYGDGRAAEHVLARLNSVVDNCT